MCMWQRWHMPTRPASALHAAGAKCDSRPGGSRITACEQTDPLRIPLPVGTMRESAAAARCTCQSCVPMGRHTHAQHTFGARRGHAKQQGATVRGPVPGAGGSAAGWQCAGSMLLCRAGPHGADEDSREGRPSGTGTRAALIVKRLRGGAILHGLCGGAMRRVGDFGVDALEQRHARNRRSAESSTPAR